MSIAAVARATEPRVVMAEAGQGIPEFASSPCMNNWSVADSSRSLAAQYPALLRSGRPAALCHPRCASSSISSLRIGRRNLRQPSLMNVGFVPFAHVRSAVRVSYTATAANDRKGPKLRIPYGCLWRGLSTSVAHQGIGVPNRSTKLPLCPGVSFDKQARMSCAASCGRCTCRPDLANLSDRPVFTVPG